MSKFKPNVESLQQDVIRQLSQVSKLMGSASQQLGAESGDKKYGEFQQEVDAVKKRVENLV